MMAFFTLWSAENIREKVGRSLYISPSKKAQVGDVHQEVVLMFQVKKPEYNQELKVISPYGIITVKGVSISL